MISLEIDWSQVNALLTVGALAYLWRQARTVDSIKQALYGYDGKGDGAIDDIKEMKDTQEECRNAIGEVKENVASLSGQVEYLSKHGRDSGPRSSHTNRTHDRER